jgi:hypothetical protein
MIYSPPSRSLVTWENISVTICREGHPRRYLIQVAQNRKALPNTVWVEGWKTRYREQLKITDICLLINLSAVEAVKLRREAADSAKHGLQI